ncbi:MAG: bifunctional diaminohydroxyphosphoribosylaminopyrimidine deaminase/5-amino-6-(5-phosphoribosylamino)uracil reductase RibD [Verrucomicrobiae bacterium]|nr:bifunctional diaminohydroxyphosphoribosylaminopyrimidine deaminase/5-amino-6-(5-phosphoribosylamino)uracil reductase RibD [Verrucomicrobiae bacterium]
MRRALALAERACGQTSPNPVVGAVVARRGKIVGEGFHKGAGEPHAETLALKAAGKRAKGAVLYVTLEPCCTQGRTPPCTDAILRAGIKRVVIATEDPNPKHHKRGIAILRHKGLKVQVGLLKDEAVRLNVVFNKWIITGLPFVTLKVAMSLDGKIATELGESKWITGPEARAFAHKLRARHDAVLVGINTVLRDDPALTVRKTLVAQASPPVNVSSSQAGTPVLPKQPFRIVLDTSGRIPLTSQLLGDRFRQKTIVVTTKRCGVSRREEIQSRGAKVLVAPLRGDTVDLLWALRQLARMEITSILVEGGGEAIASFLEQDLADRAIFFYAPIVIGGKNSVNAVGGKGIARIEDALRLRNMSCQKIGNDWLVTGEL